MRSEAGYAAAVVVLVANAIEAYSLVQCVLLKIKRLEKVHGLDQLGIGTLGDIAYLRETEAASN